LSLLLAADYDEPFEIYFDENVIFGPRAKAWYPVIRAMAELGLRQIPPVEPYLPRRQKTMPLQAADLTAWMSRSDRSGRGPRSDRRHTDAARTTRGCRKETSSQ
jgi:hypothetical protein